MSNRSTEHATFVIERTYPAQPAQVFRAFAAVEEKAKWFGPPSLGPEQIDFDFRIGGTERFEANGPGGARYSYHAIFQDIVEGERIVYTYEMYRNDERISVSVSTVELSAAEGGTALAYTEQGVYLDGLDGPGPREHGTRVGLEALTRALEA